MLAKLSLEKGSIAAVAQNRKYTVFIGIVFLHYHNPETWGQEGAALPDWSGRVDLLPP